MSEKVPVHLIASRPLGIKERKIPGAVKSRKRVWAHNPVMRVLSQEWLFEPPQAERELKLWPSPPGQAFQTRGSGMLILTASLKPSWWEVQGSPSEIWRIVSNPLVPKWGKRFVKRCHNCTSLLSLGKFFWYKTMTSAIWRWLNRISVYNTFFYKDKNLLFNICHFYQYLLFWKHFCLFLTLGDIFSMYK